MRGGYGPIIETMLSNGMILISIQKLVYMVRHRWQLQPYLIRVKLPLKEEANLSINTLLGANALHSTIPGGSCVIIEKHTVTFS